MKVKVQCNLVNDERVFELEDGLNKEQIEKRINKLAYKNFDLNAMYYGAEYRFAYDIIEGQITLSENEIKAKLFDFYINVYEILNRIPECYPILDVGIYSSSNEFGLRVYFHNQPYIDINFKKNNDKIETSIITDYNKYYRFDGSMYFIGHLKDYLEEYFKGLTFNFETNEDNN